MRRTIRELWLTLVHCVLRTPFAAEHALRSVGLLMLTLIPFWVATPQANPITERDLQRIESNAERLADATEVNQRAIGAIQQEMALQRQRIGWVEERQDKYDRSIQSLTSATNYGIISIWIVGFFLGSDKLRPLWEAIKRAAPMFAIMASGTIAKLKKLALWH